MQIYYTVFTNAVTDNEDLDLLMLIKSIPCYKADSVEIERNVDCKNNHKKCHISKVTLKCHIMCTLKCHKSALNIH